MPQDGTRPKFAALLLLVCAAGCVAQRDAQSADLTVYIDTLKAIDSHAHPMAYVPSGAPADTDFDALPLDGLPPFSLQWGLASANPAFRDAERALYGVITTDTAVASRKLVSDARQRLMADKASGFPAWALDRAHIDVMLANRIAMGPGLTSPRFRWVAFDDALMLPLDTGLEGDVTPDRRALYPLEAKLLQRYLHDLGVPELPKTLAEYETAVVQAELERQHSGGAVAIKFEAAYLRSLDFGPDDSVAAGAIYARYVGHGAPPPADYRTLEDHLFRVITRNAGHLGMAVQIHVTEGFGGFYAASGSSPALLESVFNDSTLRGTNFVIVHGGWPRTEETLTLLAKPNVYTDISMMDLIAEPAAVARTLRVWLNEWPEKVMFGTDAFEGGPSQGWEEVAWVASRNARKELAGALLGMVRDGEITNERARVLARLVLRDNALAAYHLRALMRDTTR
ncbi:MAG TPA: hypothetical protein VGL65_05145 [Gemmatimonadales bacterium]|jgi:predicted TIM-barrel fold metal-dependent hydrolase